MDTAVVIVPAAGRGRRMGEGEPKQYRRLQGRSVLWHTLARLQASPRIHGIVVAIQAEDGDRFAAVLAAGGLDKVRSPVTGGSERVDSVRAGLQSLAPRDQLVLVHDAVRPWVSLDLIGRIVDGAAAHGAVVPVLPVTETVKVVEGGRVAATPRRSRLYHAQTPQGFRRDLLVRAYAAAEASAEPATDDSGLVERLGVPVHAVPGESVNAKITTLEDLPASDGAEGLRVGTGYDVHAFAEGRRLVLGGVPIPADRGLLGHSDADVLTHAIIDALLGAARLGDIGRLFPDTDMAYAGISSLLLLERVRDLLQGQGVSLVNLDAVVLAQTPRLAPHVEAMAAALATALRVDPERISLKATTTEGLGFVGRREGIAAQAVALVRRS